LLDGGHLLFYAIEAIRGRPLSDATQEFGFKIGFAVVIGLMLFATWNDLSVVEGWLGFDGGQNQGQ
jgi:regulator of sigma E protease